jgi:hypothetical protein
MRQSFGPPRFFYFPLANFIVCRHGCDLSQHYIYCAPFQSFINDANKPKKIEQFRVLHCLNHFIFCRNMFAKKIACVFIGLSPMIILEPHIQLR